MSHKSINIDALDLPTLDLSDREAEIAADKLIDLAFDLHHGNASGAFCLLITVVAEFAMRTNAPADLIKLALLLLSEWREEARKGKRDAT